MAYTQANNPTLQWSSPIPQPELYLHLDALHLQDWANNCRQKVMRYAARANGSGFFEGMMEWFQTRQTWLETRALTLDPDREGLPLKEKLKPRYQPYPPRSPGYRPNSVSWIPSAVPRTPPIAPTKVSTPPPIGPSTPGLAVLTPKLREKLSSSGGTPSSTPREPTDFGEVTWDKNWSRNLFLELITPETPPASPSDVSFCVKDI